MLNKTSGPGSLSRLPPEQREQVLMQVQFHLQAPPVEEVVLNDVLTLRLRIAAGVTRPMSSKRLARWLWENPTLFRGRSVLDMGTGSGVQGITCLLGGARRAVLSDVTWSAVNCARANVAALGLLPQATVVRSDVFDAIPPNEAPFDLIVFAQPYFGDDPLVGHECTRGMLDPGLLLPRFFASARTFLVKGGRLVLMAWNFAGIVNDPVLVGRQHGWVPSQVEQCDDVGSVQRGVFNIVTFVA